MVSFYAGRPTFYSNARPDPSRKISDQCDKCSKWQFVGELRAVDLTKDGETQGLLLCSRCISVIRQLENATAAKRFDLPFETVQAISRIYRSTWAASRAAKPRFKANTMGLDHVLTVWIRQNGYCALTGRKMRLEGKGSGDLDIPSIDRIDSLFGYEAGNVQWVCWGINLMKQDLGQDEFIRWRRRVATHKAKEQKVNLLALRSPK